MNDDPLESLVERLNQGELSAAEEIVRAYEPYLRRVVRRSLPAKLRAKFDSVDVVQSVWAHLLRGLHRASWNFPDRNHLIALLVTITRRRLLTRLRHYQPALEREQAGAEMDLLASPRPSQPAQLVQAEELWNRLLTLCPSDHRELLRLKKEGWSVAEIAVRTGLHPTSVRRVLRRLSLQLALDKEGFAALRD